MTDTESALGLQRLLRMEVFVSVVESPNHHFW